MKKKQVLAALLCGLMTLGTATPVLAAEAGRTDEVKQTAQQEPTADDFITDGMLRSMSASLTALIKQLESDYNGLTENQKYWADQILADYLDAGVTFEETVQALLATVSFDALKEAIKGQTAEDADALLTQGEEAIVAYIDILRQAVKDGRLFADDKKAYVDEQLAIVNKQLSSLLYTTPELYTQEYLDGLKDYLQKVLEVTYTPETHNEIIDLLNEATAYMNESEKHLSKFILEEAIKMANSYPEFLALAPVELLDQKAFDGINGAVNYQETGEYSKDVIDYANSYLQNFDRLSYANMNAYHSYFYGNMIAAYQGVSSAILSETSKLEEEVSSIDYTGTEKTAYDQALKAYNEAIHNKNYPEYAPAAEALQKAAAAYNKAAKEYALEQAKNQITALTEKLTAIQEDISAHPDYYTDTYAQQVKNALNDLASADPEKMDADELLAILKNAASVVKGQSDGYGEKLTALVEKAKAAAEEANQWWSLIPEEFKSKAPYADAIALTDGLTAALSDTGIYDIEQLETAWKAFEQDFNSDDSVVQKAAKAVAEYVLADAQNVYEEESQKPHNEGVLEALKAQIDELKASLVNWDYTITRESAEKARTAQADVLNDKVQTQPEDPKPEEPKPVVPDQNKPDSDTGNKGNDKAESPNTSDDLMDIFTPSVLSALALAGITILFQKRKEDK